MPISKIVFIVATWPMGLVVIPQFYSAGNKVYATAVGLIVIALMGSALMYTLSPVKKSKPVLYTGWYSIKLSLAAFLSFSFIVAPKYLSYTQDKKILVWVAAVLIGFLVLAAIGCAYQRATEAWSPTNSKQ